MLEGMSDGGGGRGRGWGWAGVGDDISLETSFPSHAFSVDGGLDWGQVSRYERETKIEV